MIVKQIVDFGENSGCARATERPVDEVVLDINQKQRVMFVQLCGELQVQSQCIVKVKVDAH